VGSYQEDAFEKHTHEIIKDKSVIEWYLSPKGTHGVPLSTWDASRGNSSKTQYRAGEAGQSSETRPANAYVHFIIKYE
jgi:hypothetical protein